MQTVLCLKKGIWYLSSKAKGDIEPVAIHSNPLNPLWEHTVNASFS